jgi:hypothetical protein
MSNTKQKNSIQGKKTFGNLGIFTDYIVATVLHPYLKLSTLTLKFKTIFMQAKHPQLANG